MNVRAATKLILIASAVLVGLIAGATGRASLATTEDHVLHLIVEQRTDLDAQPRVIEYWLDDQRVLAKSVETVGSGTHTNSSGPNWFLQVPPRGRAQYVETLTASGPARSVWASLFYFRDALRAGVAQTLARSQDVIAVRIGSRSGAFEATSGLPLWDEADGTRTEYSYRVREQLPVRAFPVTFFNDAQGRDVTSTFETTRERAATLVTFRLPAAAQELVGRPLDRTLVTLNPSDLTREQVTYLYRDITVTVSLLAQEPTLVRRGGLAITTPIGQGLMFEDTGRAQLLVLDRALATNVHAPDAQTALAASAALAANR